MSTSNWKWALNEALQFHDPEKTANGGSTYMRMKDWEVNRANISSKMDYDVFSKAKANYHKDFANTGTTHVTTIGIGSQPLFQWQKFPEDWHVVYESDSDSEYSDSSTPALNPHSDEWYKSNLAAINKAGPLVPSEAGSSSGTSGPLGTEGADPREAGSSIPREASPPAPPPASPPAQIASAVNSEPAPKNKKKNKKKRKTHPSVATRCSSRPRKARDFYRDEKW